MIYILVTYKHKCMYILCISEDTLTVIGVYLKHTC